MQFHYADEKWDEFPSKIEPYIIFESAFFIKLIMKYSFQNYTKLEYCFFITNIRSEIISSQGFHVS